VAPMGMSGETEATLTLLRDVAECPPQRIRLQVENL
jgi:hypothetical protein